MKKIVKRIIGFLPIVVCYILIVIGYIANKWHDWLCDNLWEE